ncbi:hypothetical protein AVEN_216983-1 [Araneus ventricosus]|uniref:Uncharacterized protein n=1 Tax=Araneus ventricosus TaxID=182803 RepID=A0A4Y1ZJR8_ARAVE|nr:hypothetical protein AVEN_216983-1 [Araneus ventricosus]
MWRVANNSTKMSTIFGHFENVVSSTIPTEQTSFLVCQEETGFKKIFSAHMKSISLVLQFLPNAVHSPLPWKEEISPSFSPTSASTGEEEYRISSMNRNVS